MATKTLEEFLNKLAKATSLIDGLMPKEDKAKSDETEDYVIDTWIAADHLSYYKKYKSGLVIQGGYVASATTSSKTTTITFSVELTTTPAKLVVQVLKTNSASSYDSSPVYTVSNTGFTVTQFSSAGNADIGFYWEAIGYLTPA